MRLAPLSSSDSRRILNAAKDGKNIPAYLITKALESLGEMPSMRPGFQSPIDQIDADRNASPPTVPE